MNYQILQFFGISTTHIDIMFIYFIINFLLTVFRVPSSPSEFLSPYGKKTKGGREKIFSFH